MGFIAWARNRDRQNVRRCFRRDREPCPRLFRRRQFAVMPKDHLRRVTRFQRNAVHVLNLCKPITDERMPQGVLFPLDLGVELRRCALLRRTKPCCAARRARSIAWRNRQPVREIVRRSARCAAWRLCFVRCHFDEARPTFDVRPIQPQNFLRTQTGKRSQRETRRKFAAKHVSSSAASSEGVKISTGARFSLRFSTRASKSTSFDSQPCFCANVKNVRTSRRKLLWLRGESCRPSKNAATSSGTSAFTSQ